MHGKLRGNTDAFAQPSATMSQRIAVIGGGYAGFAAAVTLAAAGREITVFETARTLGGRARRVDSHGAPVDNGAHILLGAYRQFLELVRLVHGAGAEDELFDRRRLVLEQPGVFRLRTPTLPAPWHLAAALFTMRGVPYRDRLRTMVFARRLARGGFRCSADLTVSALLADQPASVTRLLWEPLCLAALNTPTDTASAQIFLNVMRFSFAARTRDSDLLLPRVDLSTLFPDAAAAFVTDRGGEIRGGTAVSSVVAVDGGVDVASGYSSERFDAAVVAVGPHQVSQLLEANGNRLAALLAQIAAFSYQPITTAYLQYGAALSLGKPLIKLDGAPGQWMFDRGLLDGPVGLASVVISTDASGEKIPHEALAHAIDAQLHAIMPKLSAPLWTQVIAERRATYACTPGRAHPAAGLLLPHLCLAGDYTDPELPATLEAATRSGVIAARALLAGHP
ncbi:MAG: hydroxysqualene dehydroxylase HpnE [Betaproteobacteria bacterium]